jgi:uncharacterized protein (TIGR03118 family)
MKPSHNTLVALSLVATFVAGCGGPDSAASTPPASADPVTVTEPLSIGDHGKLGWHEHAGVAQVVERRNIVSNLPGAIAQDPSLRNAWGLAFNPNGAAWVSANETGLSAVYDPQGHHLIPSVRIPPPPGMADPSHPTGQVFNANPNAFKKDRFIFVTEDGTISGWQGGFNATLRVNNAGDAIYKGVTIATDHRGRTRLYAANFFAGRIDVFDDAYNPVETGFRFRDFFLPAGFAPFNVEQIRGLLFVTYAKQDADREDDVAGPGNGFVDVFSPDGFLLSRLISRGALNSPWGIALAPEGFGQLGGKLLVGNFGDGRINVYDLTQIAVFLFAEHEGMLGTDETHPIVIDDLWALKFGVDANGFSSTHLYFTAGPNDEEDGIFGELVAQP